MNVWRNLAIFAAVYIPTVALVWWALRDRLRQRCDRCGELWEKTDHGNDFHICRHRGVLQVRRSL